MRSLITLQRWSALLVLLIFHIRHATCGHIEFVGDLSPQASGHTRELVYVLGTEQTVSWRGDVPDFNISICQDTETATQVCQLHKEYHDQNAVTDGAATASTTWAATNDGLSKNKNDGFYLNISSSYLASPVTSRQFSIVWPGMASQSPETSGISSTTFSTFLTTTTRSETANENANPAETESQSLSSPTPTSSSSNTNTLNTGTIAGIAVGAVIGVIVVLLLVLYMLRRKGFTIGVIRRNTGNGDQDRNKEDPSHYHDGDMPKKRGVATEDYKRGSEIGGAPIFEVEGTVHDVPAVRYELDGDGIKTPEPGGANPASVHSPRELVA